MRKSGLSRINGFSAISVISSSVRMQGKVVTLSKDDPVLNNAQTLALEHFDRVLARVRWLGTAHSGKNQGFYGSMDSRPFRSYRPWFVCKASQDLIQRKPSPKDALPLALEHFDRVLARV